MALQSFHGTPRSIMHAGSSLEKPTATLVPNFLKSISWRIQETQRLISSTDPRKPSLHVKAANNLSTLSSTADTPVTNSSASLQMKNAYKSTFPNGIQTLVEDVCDQTSIAELKLKIGDFEMILKRDVGISNAQNSVSAPTSAPSFRSMPMADTVASLPPPPPVVEKKSTAADSSPSPFAYISAVKASKLAALEASGQNAVVLLSSPAVGLFRKGRIRKGERQPPICKEGGIIKEGQIIGFLDQFGGQLPIRSDVAGEVFRILYEDGEAVAYGDPLMAVLPSFHEIE